MQKTKKTLKGFLSLMMVFSIIFQSIGSVYAKTVTLDRETSMSSYLTVAKHTDNLGATHPEQGKRVFKIDGQYAYCIESDVGLSNEHIYQDGQSAQDILTTKPNKLTTWQQKYDLLSALLSMVPKSIINNNKTEHIQWLVAQTMVWEITGEERDQYFQYKGNTYPHSTAYRDVYMWTSGADKQTFESYYKELEKRMQDYWKIPSFMSKEEGQKTLTLDQFDGTYYYATFQDENQVLDHYDFSSSDIIVEKQNQQLTLKSQSPSSSHLTASLNSSFQYQAPIFWSDGDFQKTMTSGELKKANLKAYVDVKVGKGSLEIVKKDHQETPLSGAVFEITSPSGKSQTYTTNQGGKILLENVESGTYVVKEKSAPIGYLINETTVELKVVPSQTTTHVFKNDEPMGSIELQKAIDSSSTNGQLGDAYLSGNEYSLYAKEKITNRSQTKVYFEKDQLVGKAQTDNQGKLKFSNLYLGKYYIKETKSNPSLQLNSKILDVTLSYQDMHTSFIVESLQTSNVLKSQRIRIFKQGESEGHAGVVSGLAKAEFTFVLNSEYEKVGFEKAHHYFVGETDQQGYLTTPLLPYGVYRVRETKTPQGFYGASDFLVTIDKDTHEYEVGYQIQNVVVNNLPFESMLKIVKTDAQSGKVVQIAGATFKIKNLDTNEYVSYTDWSQFPNINVNQWTTHEDGTITLNTKLKVGHYQLEETKAPDGYVLAKDPVPFEITQKHYEISNDGITPITVVKFQDQPVVGRITIEKQGEVLTDFQDGQFVYEQRGIANVKFGIYAAQDILDPCQDKSVLYQKGELIETIVTSENGKITSRDLPLGEYECKELETPFGFVHLEETKKVTLSYADQLSEIVYEKAQIWNQRQKVIVDLSKKDQDTNNYVAGATLSLIANRDVYNVDGKIIVKAGTVIESVVSHEEGKVQLQTDLPIDMTPEYAIMPLEESDYELIGNPNALFVVKETKQPDGYVSKKVNYYIDTAYTSEVEEVLHFEYDFYNQQTKTLIHKVDQETQDILEGAHLQVIDPVTQQVIADWVSSKEGYSLLGLVVNKDYILHEVKAPDGYMIAQDMTFHIEDLSEQQLVTLINQKAPVITLGDEPEIVKTDDHTIFYTYLLMGLGAFIFFAVLWKKDENE